MAIRPLNTTIVRRTSGLALLAAGILIASVLAAPAGAASETRTIGPFNVTFYGNLENDGTHWGYQNWTATQKDDFAAAVAVWDSHILNAQGRQIVVHAFWDNLGGDTLGEAYGPTNGDGTTGWSYAEHVWREGVNYSGRWSAWDAYVVFDIGAAGAAGGWNFGSGAPLANQMDFRSVAAHEVGLGVGFGATYDWDYDDWGNALGTEASPYAWAGYRGLSRWDENLRDAAGNRPSKGGTGTPGNFDECSDPAYFVGAKAVASYGANVPVYAPDPYEDGSSLHHLDDLAFPGALMGPVLGEGETKRAPTRLECEILKDLGWSVLTTKTWTKGVSTLHWGDAGNWDPNGSPDVGWDVTFTNTGLTYGNVIALDADRTIYTLSLNTTVTFALGETGHTLTLARGNLTRSAGSGGTQILRGIVDVGDGGVWNVGGPGELVVSGIATDPGGLLDVKGGAYLTFEGIQDWGPDSTLLVREGVVSLNTDAGSAAEANLSIEILGGTVNFGASQYLDSLEISGGKAVLKPGGSKVLVLNSLWIDTGSGLGSGPLETVPEPATLALVVLGAALAVWRRRR